MPSGYGATVSRRASRSGGAHGAWTPPIRGRDLRRHQGAAASSRWPRRRDLGSGRGPGRRRGGSTRRPMPGPCGRRSGTTPIPRLANRRGPGSRRRSCVAGPAGDAVGQAHEHGRPGPRRRSSRPSAPCCERRTATPSGPCRWAHEDCEPTGAAQMAGPAGHHEPHRAEWG